ncbi:PEP-CTERM putative exosortase interaction domain-containing protein [Cylindrospermum stagnale PCC 7417]|uniref:PEP-CTERM putative exosortase interaction domain-containing protein n=1 Tax=Cylindrospermum stagnale PCC 7417 TaxID=56107 RepID=K9WSH5_9NOST|nr:PEP-CTERM sorting domain-containing protein [Cylindrospermum stagnale]AFZ22492.1 PEP-CTERM putative exosortase interaction domain-containing protein [Cylindrospermum stagnale PCC 7417]
MKTKFSTFVASALLTTGIVTTVAAAPTHAAVNCSITNVSLGGVSATDCEGAFNGNDTGALDTKLANGLFSDIVGAGVAWTLAGKSDQGSNPFIQAANGSTTGAWSLKQPLSSNTFVVSLKASNSYSAYLFNDYDFSKGLTGIFNTIGVSVNGQGKAQGLSHASLYISNKPKTPPVTEVPEPTALVGLSLVASGMVFTRRRRVAG